MAPKQHHFVLTIFLIIVVCMNLFNVGSVHADGEPPTEPPAPTQVETEPASEPTDAATEIATELPAEGTPVPAGETPVPEEATATPLAEILTQLPENTEVVVLDEDGDAIPLATEAAAEIVTLVDPMWCPEGVLPGGPGCTTNFVSISALITNMVTTTGNYMQNGVIYFTANPGTGTFNLTPTTLPGGDFDTLNDFNLTLQGGWNGDTVAPIFSGQTNFGTSPITIGTSANPWVGNLTLNDITFTGASQTSLTIYTTTGDITLNNVDVNNQGNGRNTALVNSTSGDITVSNGTFDGNSTNSGGFSATTTTGSITISDSSFTDNKIPTTNTVDGATLSAATVTLTNVSASNNDGDGIAINNASVVTLNNVVATNNGTDPVGPNNNDGSGVLINGTAGSSVFINGGSFSSNKEYGIEIGNPANTTIYILSNPTCTNNKLACSNDTFAVDTTAPIITPNVSGTAGSGSWYTSAVSVSWSVSDPETGIASSTGCTASNLTTDTGGTTLTCSATNNFGLSNTASVSIKIDKGAPVLSLPSDITTAATGPSGAIVNYSASATDDMDPSVSVSCSPASGSTFSMGTTTVNCSSTDEAGNTASGSFLVTVTSTPATATNTPTNTPTSTPTTPAATPTPPIKTPAPSSSQSNSSTFIVPITGGAIDLDCDSVFSAFGIQLLFINLCDQQATIKGVTSSSLPGKLPNGFTLVAGLHLQILSEGEILQELPDGSGVQMDFPTSGADDQFAVLFWNGNAWVEITQTSSEDKVSVLVNANAANEFYHIGSTDGDFYKVLTTEKTGIFVLVKK
jgi:hypothetical protein